MSQVSIAKVQESAVQSHSLFDEIKDLGERVQRRAYDLFRQRGPADGSALDDWLKAEREFVFTPQSDLIETNANFQLQAAVPGFDANDLEVTATPDTLILRAHSRHKHDRVNGDVHFCEFGERQLFRRIDLPASIDPDKVTAKMDKGMLQITAPKKITALVKVDAAAA